MITPALSAEEWVQAKARRGKAAIHDATSDLVYTGSDDVDPAAIARVIAVANDALPDFAPRKITRAQVREVRLAAQALRQSIGLPADKAVDNPKSDFHFRIIYLERLADAIESYLPPEGM